MKKLVLIGLGLFWMAVLAMIGVGLAPTTISSNQSPGVSGRAGGRTLMRADVAAHGSAADCWMIIGTEVYDVTSYIPKHPTPAAVLLPWCGQDASQAYRDKGGRGRSHSDVADELLATFSIGQLKK